MIDRGRISEVFHCATGGRNYAGKDLDRQMLIINTGSLGIRTGGGSDLGRRRKHRPNLGRATSNSP